MKMNLKDVDKTASPRATIAELQACLNDIQRAIQAWAILYRNTVDSDGLPDEFGVTCSVLNAKTLASQLYLAGLRDKLEAKAQSEQVFDE